jgi:hypothetical protein
MTGSQVTLDYSDAGNYATKGNQCISQNQEALRQIGSTLGAGIHVGDSGLVADQLVQNVFRADFDKLNALIEYLKAATSDGMVTFAETDQMHARLFADGAL